jgi:hypothetical protein
VELKFTRRDRAKFAAEVLLIILALAAVIAVLEQAGV